MAFFQQLPQEPSAKLAEQLGLSLSEGVARNFPQPELLVQQRMQRNALDEFKNSIQSGDTPQDIAEKYARASISAPGAAELLQPLYKQTLYQSLFNAGGSGAKKAYAQEQQANKAQQPQQGMQSLVSSVPNSNMQSQNQPLAPSVGAQSAPQNQGYPMGAGIMPGGGIAPGGFSPEDMMAASMLGYTPEQYLRYKSGVPQEEIASELQAHQLGRSEKLADYATTKLTKKEIAPTQDEINDFMRIGNKYSNMSPEDWFKATKKDFDKYLTNKAQLDSANIPGWISGLMRGGKYREKTLSRLDDVIKPMLELGEENYVREKLADLGLSPTEIEMRIKPLDQSIEKSLANISNAPYKLIQNRNKLPFEKDYEDVLKSNPEKIKKNTEQLADFLTNNVKPNVSLLSLREKLRQDKGYDWKQYSEALKQAVANGLQLTPDQLNESGELTNSPRDSLIDIFQKAGRIWDFIQGKK